MFLLLSITLIACDQVKRDAEMGYVEAQIEMGNRCFEEGDEYEGARWYRKAAEQGHSVAQYNLGVCYQVGSGVVQSNAEAIKWYRKAAEQGDADAQKQLDALMK